MSNADKLHLKKGAYMAPRLPKDLTLRVTVASRDLRFATNLGLNFTLNLVGLDETFRADGSHNFLHLEVPPKKYWAQLHEAGYLFLGDRGYGVDAYWPQHMTWPAMSREESDQLRSRRFSVTEVQFSQRREALDSWASMFVQPLTASLVSNSICDRLDLLPHLLLDSGYSYELWAKSEQHYNSLANRKAFRLMISEALDGVVTAMPEEVK